MKQAALLLFVILHTQLFTIKTVESENINLKTVNELHLSDGKPALASKSWYYTEFTEHAQQGINLQCHRNAAARSQGTNITWYKDGSIITTNDRVKLRNNDEEFFIGDPLLRDKGWYNCSLWHQGEIIDSYAREITVDEQIHKTAAKVVDVDPVDRVRYINLGDSFNISCTFYVGIPNQNNPLGFTLERYWYFNGSQVPDTQKTTYGIGTSDNETETVLLLTVNNATEKDLGTYQCFGANALGGDHQNITVEIAKPADDNPNPIPLWAIISVAATGFLILLALSVTGIVIAMKRRQEELEWPTPDMEHYDVPVCELEYDVFISYSSEDEDWVKDELLGNLEKAGYRVYIDFKDFVPGMAIAENVLDAVYKSRKTIIVMSKNFLKSMWGQYELQQAHNKAIVKRDDVLVLIKYGKCKVPGKLMGKTFLDWTDSSVKPHFWSRLADFLGKPGNFRDSLESSEEKTEDHGKDVITNKLTRMTSDYDSDFVDMESSDDVFLSSGSERMLGIQKQKMLTEDSVSSAVTRNRVSTETNSRVSCDDEFQRLIP
ncbi:interleukin-1 receptor accessory protein-like 1-B [Saccostrea cucullata]|uniref:interleukin-1 receptor accessory protein-like 1-B n=1 Tax=Saccostrea cuccullata TaxID=36930 RepID=UPI002ED5DD86